MGPPKRQWTSVLVRKLCDDQRVSIGRPMIDNVQIPILNAELEPVALGKTGELCIDGIGLARGYLNRPELTAEKFVHNPFFIEEPMPGSTAQAIGRVFWMTVISRRLSLGR